jgi:hypothetical protein
MHLAEAEIMIGSRVRVFGLVVELAQNLLSIGVLGMLKPCKEGLSGLGLDASVRESRKTVQRHAVPCT